MIKEHGECCVCGQKNNLVTHHKIPFHVAPELEMEESNLEVICEGPGVNCHLMLGHLNNYRSYNPEFEQDVSIWKAKILNRPAP